MDLRDTNRPTVNLLYGPGSDPSGDSPKLSDAEGVPSDMGSAAFERVMPAGYVGQKSVQRHANLRGTIVGTDQPYPGSVILRALFVMHYIYPIVFEN